MESTLPLLSPIPVDPADQPFPPSRLLEPAPTVGPPTKTTARNVLTLVEKNKEGGAERDADV